MPIDAVLFDKDGTLVDLFSTWMPAYRAITDTLAAEAGAPGLAPRLLAAAGYDAAADRLVPGSMLASGTNAEIAEAWSADPAIADRARARRLVLEMLHAHVAHNPVPVVPLGPLLGGLRRRGLAVGLATMDTTEGARKTLEVLGVEHLVDFVVGYDAVAAPKPAPDMVLAFGRALGLAPARVAMVGDSEVDLRMARAAGAGLSVGVLTGGASHAQLAPWADVVLPSVATLDDALRGVTPG